MRPQSLFKGAPRAKKITGDGHDEHWHQTVFIRWTRETARLQSDPVKCAALEWLHSIPNGSYVHRVSDNRRAPRQALKLIDEGLTAGVWDLRLDYLIRDESGAICCPGLIIEMKMPGRYLSPEQKAYGEYMLQQGFEKAFCRNWKDAARAVVDYMKLTDFAVIPNF